MPTAAILSPAEKVATPIQVNTPSPTAVVKVSPKPAAPAPNLAAPPAAKTDRTASLVKALKTDLRAETARSYLEDLTEPQILATLDTADALVVANKILSKASTVFPKANERLGAVCIKLGSAELAAMISCSTLNPKRFKDLLKTPVPFIPPAGHQPRILEKVLTPQDLSKIAKSKDPEVIEKVILLCRIIQPMLKKLDPEALTNLTLTAIKATAQGTSLDPQGWLEMISAAPNFCPYEANDLDRIHTEIAKRSTERGSKLTCSFTTILGKADESKLQWLDAEKIGNLIDKGPQAVRVDIGSLIINKPSLHQYVSLALEHLAKLNDPIQAEQFCKDLKTTSATNENDGETLYDNLTAQQQGIVDEILKPRKQFGDKKRRTDC